MTTIPASEIVSVLLEDVIHGSNYSRTGDTFCCEQYITTASGWRIEFFIDCGEVDYVDKAVAPDGRVGAYNDWDGLDPVHLLASEHPQEFGAFEVKLLDTPITQ